MGRIIGYLDWLLLVPPYGDRDLSPGDRARARLLAGLIVINSASSLFFCCVFLFLPDGVQVAAISGSTFALLMAIAGVYRVTGNFRAAGMAFIGLFIVGFSVSAGLQTGAITAMGAWGLVPVVLATYLLGTRAGVVVAVWLVGLAVVFVMLESAGWWAPDAEAVMRAVEPAMVTVAGTTALGFVLLVVSLYERAQRLAAEQLSESLRRLRDAQSALVETSRQAGKAEVATGVLHNVGNALNSVNVIADVVGEKLRDSPIGGLTKAVALLEAHEGDLGEYLTRDARGSKLLPYLSMLASRVEGEREELLAEVADLRKLIGHINVIISHQQKFAKTVATVEKCSIRELLQQASSLVEHTMERHEIALVLDVDESLETVLDRHIVLQILTNLLSNAKHAVIAAGRSDKRIHVRASADREGGLRIEIEDNGVGIRAQDVTKVFRHGFTTKPDGHGFGLHNAANGAVSMGGELTCSSGGEGAGATFTLSLPPRSERAGTASG